MEEKSGALGVGSGHLLTLDALRGIAAIAVLVFHIAGATGSDRVSNAFLAVDFFFILSGFVIGLAYEEKLARGLPVASFMRLRLLRIYPALIPGLLVGLAMAWSGRGVEAFAPAMLVNMLLLPVFLPGAWLYPLNTPMWSLFFELAANFGHALLRPLLTTPRLAVLLACLAAGLTAIAARRHTLNLGWEATTPWSLEFLAGFVRAGWGYVVGLLIYRLMRSGVLRPGRTPIWVSSALLVGALLAPDITGATQELFCVLIVFPVVLLTAVGEEPAGRLRWLANWLGGISYPLYAIHGPLLLVAVALLGGRAPGEAAGVLYWSAVGILIILAAAALERFYDAPIRALLRRHRTGVHVLAPAT